jgi:diguanylate cyclase (GGDEF)-like protein
MSYVQAARFGKITRRLFLIFLLFALIPTGVLTLLALRYIDSNAEQQSVQLQNDEVDNYTNLLLGRLNFITDRLGLYASHASLAARQPQESSAFSEEDSSPLQLDVSLPRILTQAAGLESPESARQHLQSGRSLLLRIPASQPGEEQLFLALALSPENLELGLATARLEPEHVLGHADNRNLRVDLCVYDENASVLFETAPLLCEAFADNSTDGAHRSHRELQVEGEGYQASFRNVFLNAAFGAADWQFAVIQPRSYLFQATEEFRRLFLAVAILVVLSISLVSVFLIRRQMSPLSIIMDGIGRVTHKDYSRPVEVSSGDEFEDMAGAFNTMSGRVSQQLVTMASMSDIDQLILSRVKKEDILQIVLEKTRDVLPCDGISMFLLDQDELEGRVYRLAEGFHGELQSQEVSLEVSQRELATSQAHFLIDGSDAQCPAYLSEEARPTGNVFQVLPIHLDQQLSALIILGFEKMPEMEEEDITLALNYVDRIAVALANAEWEDRLFRQAHYDSLTGLPNRLAFLDRLGQSVVHAHRERQIFGVLFIDLDNFKLVNDSLGHPVGDQLIKVISERFNDCLRADDTVSRLGGDEFVITAMGSGSHALTVSSLNQVATRILQAAMDPIVIDEHEIRSSASIGIALYPKDGEDPETLLKNADTAMYHAKSLGRGKFQFYSRELNEQLVELMHLSTDLRTALAKNQFELYYQPKVDVATRTIVGAEALVRWNHPDRGLVSPGSFIEAAESLGLISSLGDWTLMAACQQLRAWRDAGAEPVRVSVNISALQLQHDNMYEKIEGLLAEYGLEGSDLELEITENVLVEDMEATVLVLSQMRGLGVKVSIDDYGTGYSSLSYMKQLPVDTLKIDRCFIVDICKDKADQAIVNSTVVLANNLGMTVIAEGVEEVDQVILLHSYGCTQIQGFFFSKPLPENGFTALLTGATKLENLQLDRLPKLA